MSFVMPAAASASPAVRAARWRVRLASLAVWALLAASAVYWLLATPVRAPAPTAAVAATDVQPDTAAVARLLGQREAPAAAPASAAATSGVDRRVTVQGVAAEANGSGVALLAVDGQPAKAFRTGQTVVDAWTLQSVGTRSATLAASGQAQPAVLRMLPASAPAPNGATPGRPALPPRPNAWTGTVAPPVMPAPPTAALPTPALPAASLPAMPSAPVPPNVPVTVNGVAQPGVSATVVPGAPGAAAGVTIAVTPPTPASANALRRER